MWTWYRSSWRRVIFPAHLFCFLFPFLFFSFLFFSFLSSPSLFSCIVLYFNLFASLSNRWNETIFRVISSSRAILIYFFFAEFSFENTKYEILSKRHS